MNKKIVKSTFAVLATSLALFMSGCGSNTTEASSEQTASTPTVEVVNEVVVTDNSAPTLEAPPVAPGLTN